MDHKRITLFAGHYGSGKTNIAVNYALLLAREAAAAGELAAGNIDADPYWHNADRNPCRWCDYKAACHFEEGCGDARRYRRGVKAAEFWAWLARGEEDESDGH